MTVVYLGLGSNLGERGANLREAIRRLGERVRVERVSSFYDNPPVGYLEQPRFLNAVIKGRTTLGPQELLGFVKGIEREMGRVERFRNAPRVIDIDILLYGRLVMEKAMVTIPHPRMLERAFVLAPLAEIAPRALHPLARRSARRLFEELGEGAELIRLGPRKQKGPG